MALKRQKQEIRKTWGERLWEGNRKWFTITPACLLLVGAGWYAYRSLMVIPPPPLGTSSVQEVVDYLGDKRGFAQMPVAQRQEWLTQRWRHYAAAPSDQQQLLVQSLNRMTPAQQRVFAEATFDVIKVDVLKRAREYAAIKSAAGKADYINQSIQGFDKMRRELTGGGSLAPGMGVTAPLQAAAPKNESELQQMIITKTTPGERAQAEPFVNKVVEQQRMVQSNQPRVTIGG